MRLQLHAVKAGRRGRVCIFFSKNVQISVEMSRTVFCPDYYFRLHWTWHALEHNPAAWVLHHVVCVTCVCVCQRLAT